MERTPSADPVVASELDTLSQRLRSLDARFDEEVATSTEVMQAIDALRAELGSTAMPVAMDTAEIERTIGALMARVEGLAEAVATTVPSTSGGPQRRSYSGSSTSGSRRRSPHGWRSGSAS